MCARTLSWLLVLFLSMFRALPAVQDKGKNSPLACDQVQRCLNSGSRACWKKFYDEGSKKNDLIADVLKVFPEADFMHFVDEAENEMWPEFFHIDKNLTECMSDAGYRNHIEFCSNMRSSKFTGELEKAIEEAEKQQQHTEGLRIKRQTPTTNDQGSKCWVAAMRDCASQYDRPGEKIDNELEKCEKLANAVANEERLGFEVGKRVMLKIVAKIKEAFESDVDGATTKAGTKEVPAGNEIRSKGGIGS